MSIVVKTSPSTHIREYTYVPNLTLIDEGIDTNMVKWNNKSKYNLRTRSRPFYRKLSDLSMRTRNIFHTRTKLYNSCSTKILDNTQTHKLLLIVNKMIQLPYIPTAPIHAGIAILGELHNH